MVTLTMKEESSLKPAKCQSKCNIDNRTFCFGVEGLNIALPFFSERIKKKSSKSRFFLLKVVWFVIVNIASCVQVNSTCI